jgi:hypothetical protein
MMKYIVVGMVLAVALCYSVMPTSAYAECEGSIIVCPVCGIQTCNERCVCWCKPDTVNCPPSPTETTALNSLDGLQATIFTCTDDTSMDTQISLH